MSRGFWAARRPGWVAAGLVIAVLTLTVWLLRVKSGANTANILALTVSIASSAVAFRGLWRRPPLGRVARELADRVARERGQARRQALGMSGDARPAKVVFRSPLPGEEPELVRWRSDGGAEEGALGDVADFYRSLERGRLVVLGEPGAGKTVLATQLVIDLVEGLPVGELQPAARPPVPVWLSLPSLNLGEIGALARVSAEDMATRLDQWIAAQMSAIYQIPMTTAERLIRGSWILPVLDGLDEMDTPGPDDVDNPERPQAAAVVRALNAGTGRRPVVLVCRRVEYTQLARSVTTASKDPVLQDANQIVLQPLDVPAICDYLTRRFPGQLAGDIAARWQNVQSTLQTTTRPVPADSLARVLSSPWRLFLATAAYDDDKSDPGVLVRLPADKVGEHLLDQLVPALTLRTPRPGGDHYPPSGVRTWLATLAQHLDQTSKDLHWSATDLHLQQLWPIAGRTTARRLSTLASIAILSAGFAVLGLLWVHRNGRWYPSRLTDWIGFIGAIGFIVGLGIYVASIEPAVYRLDLRHSSPANRKRLAGRLAFGLMAGLAGGLVAQAGGLAGGLAFVLAVGLAYGLAFGLAGGFAIAERPTSVMRQNVAFGLAVGLAFGLVGGLATADGQAGGLAGGLAVGLAVGLTSGLGAGLAVWIRYIIGCWLARRQGILPRRVGQFLDWAYIASLLRMSGTAVQFRHRELQDWLVLHPLDLTAQTPPGANAEVAVPTRHARTPSTYGTEVQQLDPGHTSLQ